jgi:hypothetical protein
MGFILLNGSHGFFCLMIHRVDGNVKKIIFKKLKEYLFDFRQLNNFEAVHNLQNFNMLDLSRLFFSLSVSLITQGQATTLKNQYSSQSKISLRLKAKNTFHHRSPQRGFE